MSAFSFLNTNDNALAERLRHEGIRAGEIIAYRACRVIGPTWFRRGDDWLHSVLVRNYVWLPDEPACGDVTTHGIYSFRHEIRSAEDYGYSVRGLLLFGKVKIWGEVVEHEAGFRSQFGKIVRLDYGIRSSWRSFGKSIGWTWYPARARRVELGPSPKSNHGAGYP